MSFITGLVSFATWVISCIVAKCRWGCEGWSMARKLTACAQPCSNRDSVLSHFWHQSCPYYRLDCVLRRLASLAFFGSNNFVFVRSSFKTCLWATMKSHLPDECDASPRLFFVRLMSCPSAFAESAIARLMGSRQKCSVCNVVTPESHMAKSARSANSIRPCH